MKNTKHIFVVLKERNGEYEYSHRSVHELPNNLSVTAERISKNYAKEFYGGKPEHNDGGYYFHNGEIFVSVKLWYFISKKDYNTLRKYL